MKNMSALMYGKFALLGVVVGLFSALFGVGGGIIMVPVLVILAGFGQHMAQGVSLAAMVPTALVGAFGYWRGGNVNLLIAAAVCVGSIPAAHVGQRIAQGLPQTTLRTLFALFMVGVAARIMPSASPKSMSLLLGMSLVAVGVRLLLAR
ncbi:MAG: sulfite exporter TauE/SafE family protein [Armatimonadetes bacterium]|nr:sulfite exporter TauE/SafE family protein [Armatimonadota bacterium]